MPLAAGLAAAGVAAVGAWFTLRSTRVGLFGVQEVTLGSVRGDTWWKVHSVFAKGADAVLLAAPAIAIAIAVRPPRPPGAARDPTVERLGSATFVVATAVVATGWAGSQLRLTEATETTTLAVSLAVMAAYAATLGTDRRWWPWSLVPVAILLSGGPAWFALGRLGGYTMLSWFASVPVLVAAGLAASAWPRLARTAPVRQPADPWDERMLRPTAALNAAAAGLLVASVLAAAFDPLPIQIAIRLPTYLGARIQAEGMRARLDLIEGLEELEVALDDGRSIAHVGRGSSLPWTDDLGETEGRALAIRSLRPHLTRIVAFTNSGGAYCLQRDAGGLTWGAAETGTDPRMRLRSAVAGCGDRPWSSEAPRVVDLGALCPDADDQNVMICRATDRFVDEIVAGEI